MATSLDNKGERREKRLETLCREAEIGSDHAEKAEGSDGANPLIPTVLIQTIERGALLVELQSEAVAVLVFFLCVRNGKSGNVLGDGENVFQKNAFREVVARRFVVHRERLLE